MGGEVRVTANERSAGGGWAGYIAVYAPGAVNNIHRENAHPLQGVLCLLLVLLYPQSIGHAWKPTRSGGVSEVWGARGRGVGGKGKGEGGGGEGEGRKGYREE